MIYTVYSVPDIRGIHDDEETWLAQAEFADREDALGFAQTRADRIRLPHRLVRQDPREPHKMTVTPITPRKEETPCPPKTSRKSKSRDIPISQVARHPFGSF